MIRKHPLVWPLWQLFGRKFALAGVWALLDMSSNLFRPVLISKLIGLVDQEFDPVLGILYAMGLLLSVTLATFGNQIYFKEVSRIVERVCVFFFSFFFL